MTVYTITDDIEWTDEDVDDNVLGSGALSYEWWQNVEQDGDRWASCLTVSLR